MFPKKRRIKVIKKYEVSQPQRKGRQFWNTVDFNQNPLSSSKLKQNKIKTEKNIKNLDCSLKQEMLREKVPTLLGEENLALSKFYQINTAVLSAV